MRELSVGLSISDNDDEVDMQKVPFVLLTGVAPNVLVVAFGIFVLAVVVVVVALLAAVGERCLAAPLWMRPLR